MDAEAMDAMGAMDGAGRKPLSERASRLRHAPRRGAPCCRCETARPKRLTRGRVPASAARGGATVVIVMVMVLVVVMVVAIVMRLQQ